MKLGKEEIHWIALTPTVTPIRAVAQWLALAHVTAKLLGSRVRVLPDAEHFSFCFVSVVLKEN